MNKIAYNDNVATPTIEYGEGTLNELELKSVKAVIAYVAHMQTASDVTVSSILGAKFGASDVTELRQKDYDEVIRFLVDLNLKEAINWI